MHLQFYKNKRRLLNIFIKIEMAWGIFKKIKSGLYKAGKTIGNFIKKAAPVISAAMPFAAKAINSVKPGVGTAIQTGWNIANNTLNGTSGGGNTWNGFLGKG
jgi:phage-related protein